MYELFQEGKTGQLIEVHGFKKIVQKYSSNIVPEEQIELAFNAVAHGTEQLSYQNFEAAFSWKKPTGTDWETRCITAIREWMYKNQLSADTAFEMLLTKSGKQSQKRMTRLDFHTALAEI